jgi:hypothetical protein
MRLVNWIPFFPLDFWCFVGAVLESETAETKQNSFPMETLRIRPFDYLSIGWLNSLLRLGVSKPLEIQVLETYKGFARFAGKESDKATFPNI